MKHSIYIILSLLICVVSNAQTTTENYIKTTTYQVETPDGSVTDDEKLESVTYFDGLGRSKQIVNKQLGGNNEDIIIPIVYDDFGRQVLEYLPYYRTNSSLNYENPNTTGLFSNLENQYLNKYPDDFDSSATPNPYGQTIYESSPLNRMKEGAASGYDWRYDPNNIQTVDVDVPIPLNFSTNIDPNLIPDPSAGAQTQGEVTVTITNNDIAVEFYMRMQPSPLNVGQIAYLDTAPYVIDGYMLGQLTDDSGNLIPYYAQIQNNYLVITSTNPSHAVYGLITNLSLDVDIPYEYESFQSLESTNNTIRYEYGTNQDPVKHFDVRIIPGSYETELLYLEDYPLNTLYKTIIKDENWQPASIINKNHTTEEYRDKLGRLILKRTFSDNNPHDTYYVYDKYGNLTYVIPPLASDEILVFGSQGFRVSSQATFPWTDLVNINTDFAKSKEKKLVAYKNQELKEIDLTNEYEGQGGFTITTLEDSDIVTLNLNFSSVNAFELNQGELISLKPYGDYKDTELGRINGADYTYVFYIKNNSIMIEGEGKVNTINTTLTSNTKLSYTQDVIWSSFTEADKEFAYYYEKELNEKAKELGTNPLQTDLENEYGGQGGLNISIDENDIISITINSSTNSPLQLKQGLAIPLNTKRRIQDRELGTISGSNYGYYFAIRDNSIYVNGYGSVTTLNASFNSPPPPQPPNIDPNTVGGLCFIYHYDKRNRLINKKIPSKGWQYTVYDQLDRPILTQDANMRLDNEWLFTKYDIFGRVVYTGIYDFVPNGTEANEQLELQAIIDNLPSSSIWYEQKTNSAQTINGSPIYYTNNSYPNSNIDVLTINYYDDYNFDNSDIALTLPTSVLGQDVNSEVRTLSTGSKVKVLDTGDWITTINYYDNKHRPIYSGNKNEYLETINIVKTENDFAGNVLKKETSHVKGTNPELLMIDNFTYDHTGRLLTHTQTINGSSEELISNNTYDEYGQLIEKKVGGSVASIPINSNGLQTIDYAYNVRGWLKSVNQGNTLGDDLFGFKINYNTPEHSGVIPLYNGNISETYWQTANDNNLRSYDYSYDALNRITSANYHGNYQIVNNPSETENYSLSNVTYDKNGNITALSRMGLGSNYEVDLIDDLTYSYEALSNKLLDVSDAASHSGFSDYIPNPIFGNFNFFGDNDYSYDLNGNLISNANKKLNSINYNHLNLPVSINQFHPRGFGGGSIFYVYTADGKKLSKTLSAYAGMGNNVTTTYYAEDFTYEKFVSAGGGPDFCFPSPCEQPAKLKFIDHPEGYIQFNEFTNSFEYVYQYKDHLSNTRLSYSDSNGNNIIENDEIKREQNFYPFGLQHERYNNVITDVKNNLKTYQGQEFTEDLGLNIHEWKYRVSDPATGRFWQVDPLAEDYVYNGVYNFSENKVIWGRELEGLETWYTTTGSTNPHDNFLFAPVKGPLTYEAAQSLGYEYYSVSSTEVTTRNYNFSNEEVTALSNWNSRFGSTINGDCLACAVRGVEESTGFDVGWSIGSNPNRLSLSGRNVFDLGNILTDNNLASELSVNLGSEATTLVQSISNNNVTENGIFLGGPSGAIHSIIVTYTASSGDFSVFDQGTSWDVKNVNSTTLQNTFNSIREFAGNWTLGEYGNRSGLNWGSRFWALYKNETKTVPTKEHISNLHDYVPSGTGEADDRDFD